MTIRIGNAPCSWGVEFHDDPRNPSWKTVLAECAEAGYHGIELGPVGYMPEDPARLAEGLDEHNLELIGGVLFRPFHNPDHWDDVLDAAHRTCRALVAHDAEHFVLIDSISPRRAPTAGRPHEAEKMESMEWQAYKTRIETISRIGTEEYGLTTSIHPHAGGFMDFEDEVNRLMDEVDAAWLKLCLDTGHSTYAGFDPIPYLKNYSSRLSYVHFKSTDETVKERAIAERTGFYEACEKGIFCHLAAGEVDFQKVRDVLRDIDFKGWCTVEQDCDPAGQTVPIADAKINRDYLKSIGFH